MLSLTSLLLAATLQSQDFKTPDQVLGITKDQQSEVVLLGVWHFAYPDQDVHKTDESLRFDVLSQKRQKELNKVLSNLKDYAPTKIMLESKNQESLQASYEKFRKDPTASTSRNERVQLGFKLAHTLGHKTVYAVDSDNFLFQNSEAPTHQKLAEAAGKFLSAENPNFQKALPYMTYSDQVIAKNTISDSLLWLASPENMQRGLGLYFPKPKPDEDPDIHADFMATWWYSRNIRIFNKVNQLSKPKDRVLVIFGNGHMPILHNLFHASVHFNIKPLHEVIKADKYKPIQY